jgi:hypothetical protein
MNNLTDHQLLRDYTERRSEAAFAELVRRQVDFVYVEFNQDSQQIDNARQRYTTSHVTPREGTRPSNTCRPGPLAVRILTLPPERGLQSAGVLVRERGFGILRGRLCGAHVPTG